MNLGGAEALILVLVIVVIFGASWLPKAARNLGRAKVEVDKAQKQFNDTKAQVIEATGVEKADAALKKANRALNTSPQNMLKNAAKSAVTPAVPASDQAADDGEAATDSVADAGSSETINVDFTDD